MDSIKGAFLKTFKPTMAVKIIPLGSNPVPAILQKIHTFLKKRHVVVLDEKENIIYIEK